MRGEVKPFLKFIDGSDKRFIIPVYQRNYSWQIKQCQQLLSDLKLLINDSKKMHFLGSLVSSNMENGNREDYLIIDGQQRLTTISILLLAMANLLRDDVVTSKDDQLYKKIMNRHLVDEYNTDQRKMRLKPIHDDCIAFDALFEDESDFIDHSNITANYRFFRESLITDQIDLFKLYSAVSRLEVIDIFLEKEDNPQLIFESLNSTGLALEEGDKIRNFILMSLSGELQEEYFKCYWYKIEKNTEFNNQIFVSDFIRSYLTLKLSKNIVIRELYFEFKEYAKKLDRKEILIDLLHYSVLYRQILKPSSTLKELEENMIRLNQLDLTVIYPYLLSILNHWYKEKLSSQDTKNILLSIESYLFRRLIVGLPSNTLNKVFSTLERDIAKFLQDDSTKNYADIFSYILLTKEQRASFPSDEEFSESLLARDIYAFNSKNRQYLFSRIENGNSKEQANVIDRLKNGDYSIEHIMPQTLNKQWQKDLGEKYQGIHQKWVNTLANLTLTGYNSEYSNRPFKEKLAIENGFTESNLRLNHYVSQCKKWGEEELEKRSQLLIKDALKLWSYPTTNYAFPKQRVLSYTLEDDIDYTGLTLYSYEFNDNELTVESWIEMLKGVVTTLQKEYPFVIEQLARVQKGYIANEQLSQAYVELNGKYIYAKTSTASKISVLRYFFENCHINFESLTLNILSNKEIE